MVRAPLAEGSPARRIVAEALRSPGRGPGEAPDVVVDVAPLGGVEEVERLAVATEGVDRVADRRPGRRGRRRCRSRSGCPLRCARSTGPWPSSSTWRRRRWSTCPWGSCGRTRRAGSGSGRSRRSRRRTRRAGHRCGPDGVTSRRRA